jgi:hypothetical protein
MRCHYCGFSSWELGDYAKTVQRLNAENKRLRTALEKVSRMDEGPESSKEQYRFDRGQAARIARAALAGEGE